MQVVTVFRRTEVLNVVPVIAFVGWLAAYPVSVELLGLAPARGVHVVGSALVAAAVMWGVLCWRGRGLPFASLAALFFSTFGLTLMVVL